MFDYVMPRVYIDYAFIFPNLRTMNTYTLYIGSDNTTHQLDKPKLLEVLGAMYSGFTVSYAVGAWKGTVEETALVTVTDSEASLLEKLQALKGTLGQEAIAYQKVPILKFA